MSVQRWTAYVEDDDGNDVFVCVSPDTRGEWIRYSDHEAEVGQWAATVDRVTRERDDEHLARVKAEAEVERLTKLVYLGEHYHPDLTYKARLEELVPQHRALEAEVERLAKEADILDGRAVFWMRKADEGVDENERLQARERELEAARAESSEETVEWSRQVVTSINRAEKAEAHQRELEAALTQLLDLHDPRGRWKDAEGNLNEAIAVAVGDARAALGEAAVSAETEDDDGK